MIEFNNDFEEMLIFAERYALGRRTYAPDDVCNYIKPLIPQLSYNTISVLIKDIESEYSYGDKCDKNKWMDLLAALKEQDVVGKNE